MKGIPIIITRFADSNQPGWVDCEMTDAEGTRHHFREKVPVVTKDELDADSAYPLNGVIACEVISTSTDQQGRQISRIDTSEPWGVESTTGVTQFMVCTEQLHSIA